MQPKQKIQYSVMPCVKCGMLIFVLTDPNLNKHGSYILSENSSAFCSPACFIQHAFDAGILE